MIGRIGVLGTGALLLAAACAQDPAGVERSRAGLAGAGISGSYLLRSVDGRLPSSPVRDSAGGTVSILGGHLTLGAAPRATYVYAPAGAMAASCVHEIPNGATVDTAEVVHLPDGTSHKLPPCGDGPYTLVLARQYVTAAGARRIVSDSIAGLYTWGTVTAADSLGMVTLVGSGMGGSIDFAASGPVLRIARLHNGMPIPEPVLLFSLGLD